jgi:hypothetical protein
MDREAARRILQRRPFLLVLVALVFFRNLSLGGLPWFRITRRTLWTVARIVIRHLDGDFTNQIVAAFHRRQIRPPVVQSGAS